MEEFDHEPCHAQLKALKAKYRQRNLDDSRRLVEQMEGLVADLTDNLAIIYQQAYLRGFEAGRGSVE